MKQLALAVAGVLALSVSPAAATTYYALQTSIAGGNTQIDSAHTSTWSFTTGTAWAFGGGTFVMKKGPSSTADVTLSIYEGTNFGTLVASVSETSAAFTQSYGNVAFMFGSPLPLTSGTTYWVDLTSPAGTSGSQQYFIKGDNSSLTFVDSQNNLIPAGYVTSVTDTSGTTTSGVPSVPAVPEPLSLSLLGVALGGLGLARRLLGQRPEAMTRGTA